MKRWEQKKKKSFDALPPLPPDEFQEDELLTPTAPAYIPSSYFSWYESLDESRPREIDCPHRALLRAIIHRALLDIKDSSHWREAEKWFLSEQCGNFSFNWCLLHLDALHLRSEILNFVLADYIPESKRKGKWQSIPRLRGQLENES